MNYVFPNLKIVNNFSKSSHIEFLYRYVSNPDGKVTSEWLKNGTYELESMGRRFSAQIHLKSPFDSANARLQVSILTKNKSYMIFRKTYIFIYFTFVFRGNMPIRRYLQKYRLSWRITDLLQEAPPHQRVLFNSSNIDIYRGNVYDFLWLIFSIYFFEKSHWTNIT